MERDIKVSDRKWEYIDIDIDMGNGNIIGVMINCGIWRIIVVMEDVCQ